MADFQDWDPVIIKKKAKSTKKESNVAAAVQSGAQVEAVRKHGAASNKHSGAPIKDARKLEEETEEFVHEKLDVELRIKIQQARTAKGWTNGTSYLF